MEIVRLSAVILLTFLLLELLVYPLRDWITDAYALAVTRFFPGANVVWECTAVDETLLLVAALVHHPSTRNRPEKIARGVLFIQAFNAVRIAVTYAFPYPVVHDVVFRLGGLLALVLAFVLSTYGRGA